MEIGILGWYSNRYLIDIVGLVTPDNARFLAEGEFDKWLAHHEPDYIVIHDPPWRMERVARAAVRDGQYQSVEQLQLPGYQLLERSQTANLGGIDQILADVRTRTDPGFETQVISLIQQRRLGPLIPLGGDDVVAANLRTDGWTRGSRPTAIVVKNDGSKDKTVSLRLTCMAAPADLPVMVFVDDGAAVGQTLFTNSGSHEIALSPVQPHSQKLFIFWTDKSWRPEGKDNRLLGIHVARSEKDPVESS